MSNLSRLQQDVRHCRNAVVAAQEIVDKTPINPDGTGCVIQINELLTCEFALEAAVERLRAAEKRQSERFRSEEDKESSVQWTSYPK